MEKWQGRYNVPFLCAEWEATLVPLHISSFLARWSPLKELVPNLHFIHSILATGVKCFHVVPSRSRRS